MYSVYLLISLKDKNFYTGYTIDLKRRIDEHNQGKVFSTQSRRPLKLIYYEACYNEEDAKAREKYLKSGMGKRYLKNRLKSYLKDKNF
jgi:putative endonuclease